MAEQICPHYDIQCYTECPRCKKFYACRFCHNEVEYELCPDKDKAHMIERKDVERVKCRACSCIQLITEMKFVAIEDNVQVPSCKECSTVFCGYYCAKCKLFSKVGPGMKIWHCDGCGICRQSKKTEEYLHCDHCVACIVGKSHVCVRKNALEGDCPICFLGLSDSLDSTSFMQCGHSIHHKCLREYSKTNFRCPTCNKSIGDMSTVWSRLDKQIALHPMPEEYRNQWRRYLCADCNKECDARFHVEGSKCSHCGSYNTSSNGVAHENHPFISIEEELQIMFEVNGFLPRDNYFVKEHIALAKPEQLGPELNPNEEVDEDEELDEVDEDDELDDDELDDDDFDEDVEGETDEDDDDFVEGNEEREFNSEADDAFETAGEEDSLTDDRH